jgi:hypothetical protein
MQIDTLVDLLQEVCEGIEAKLDYPKRIKRSPRNPDDKASRMAKFQEDKMTPIQYRKSYHHLLDNYNEYLINVYAD